MKKKQVYIFAGTTEGRALAEALAEHGIRGTVFVVSEYGGSLLPESEYVSVRIGRLDRAAMEEEMAFLSEDGLIFDATHPFAVQATENIRAAAGAAGRTYVRVLREAEPDIGREGESGMYIRDGAAKTEERSEEPGVYYMDTAAEAAGFLKSTEGNVLLTTGSRDLAVFTEMEGYRERCYARVLPLPQVVAQCAELGFDAGHLICMQGPFSRELNAAMLRQIDAAWMVTKESGKTGGFPEKRAAAKEAGCGLLVIGRPKEEAGISLGEALQILWKMSETHM